MLSYKKLLLCVSIFFILLVNVYSQSIEIFTKYDTILNITNDNKIFIYKNLTLKNIYDVGIVPGQIEFKLGNSDSGKVRLDKNYSVVSYDQFGNEIETHVRTTDKFTSIILDIYYPLLPGFSYNFDLKYVLDYDSQGIFFESLNIPLRESTIPIDNGEFKVILPKNNRFTYIEQTNENTNYEIKGNEGIWFIKNNKPKSIAFEYSYIPIGFGGVRGSYIFWIGINLLLFLFLVYDIRRGIRKINKKKS